MKVDKSLILPVLTGRFSSFERWPIIRFFSVPLSSFGSNAYSIYLLCLQFIITKRSFDFFSSSDKSDADDGRKPGKPSLIFKAKEKSEFLF